jgi:hypothetical protein
MFQLKPLSREAIPGALARAERYRLLNEPWEAQSICEDVLRVDPGNQQALIMLLLALTEQFDQGINIQNVTDVLSRIQGEYERRYYTGIFHERRAASLIRQGDYRSGSVVFELVREAMRCYEAAESIRPAGNDDALLRWNTCVRLLERSPYLRPAREERAEPILSE